MDEVPARNFRLTGSTGVTTQHRQTSKSFSSKGASATVEHVLFKLHLVMRNHLIKETVLAFLFFKAFFS